MSTDWKAGDRAVYIGACGRWVGLLGSPRPGPKKRGAVYTVTLVTEDIYGCYLELAEFGTDSDYNADAFEKYTPRETSIDVFTKLVIGQKEDA